MIKNGSSTKDEVRKNFGEPTDISFKDNGLEEWKYNHARKVQKGINYVPVVNWFVSSTIEKLLEQEDLKIKHNFFHN